tara:strand:- start:1298 stop:1432 length:135 start_codon:yes stop_codon:yes gene_type:complete
MCRIGQELKMSLEEVGLMSKAEVYIWLAYFKLLAEEARANGTNR